MGCKNSNNNSKIARTATPKTDNNKPQNNNSKTAKNKARVFLLAFVLYFCYGVFVCVVRMLCLPLHKK